MLNNKYIMASLPLLAAVLGDKYGVQVRIGGDTACTDGNVIHLPSLPLDCDAKLLAQVRGFIDHESAHIRYTDFEALAKAKLNPVQQYLWNSLEDWRVENALIKIFPGCKGNFHWLIAEHFGRNDTEKAGHKNPAFSILSYVLLTVRSWDVPSIEAAKQDEATIIEQHFPNLLKDLDTILKRAKAHCQTTRDCINFALKLYKIIEQYMQDIGEDAKHNLQEMLQACADALPKHMGESLAQGIQGQKAKGREHAYTVATVGHKHSSSFPPTIIDEIMQSSRALRTRLHGLLQASTQSPCMLGRRGKLNPAKLHNLVSHNPRIFLKRAEKREVSTAVHILLDCSGSMDGPRMELASKACYGLALALEQYRGVNVAVTLFPATTTNRDNNEIAIYPLVKHGQKVHPRFNIKASGCTPLTESLWWTMQQMYRLKESRKIILIITDGVPDSIRTTKDALAKAQQFGFETLGLGIEDSSLEMLMPPNGNNPSRTIHDLSMLPTTMFEMLQKSLIQRGNV